MQPDVSESMFDTFLTALTRDFPDLQGRFEMLGLMGWPLAFCALLILTILLERSVFFLRSSYFGKYIYEGIREDISHYENEPKTLRDEAMTVALSEIQLKYFSGIKLLRTISMISPLLGLLGTILGIIAAFKVIAAQTGAVSPSVIAEGLWEAMLTTAAGLMVALPAIMAAYIFKYLADRHLHKLYLRLNRLSMEYSIQSKAD